VKPPKQNDAVITVGLARGFLVKRAPWPHHVITAAHCLPQLPPAHPASFSSERSYLNLLGPLGEEPSIAAECLFIDPIADLAVLGSVDNQAYIEHAEAYEQFVEGRSTFRVEPLRGHHRAWVLTLTNEWVECTVDVSGGEGRAINIIDRPPVGGMSGSPIVSARGGAIGVVSVGSDNPGDEHFGQPALVGCLPGWLLSEFCNSSTSFLESIMSARRGWERYLHRTYAAALKKHGRSQATTHEGRR
jgi:hypothetical protein